VHVPSGPLHHLCNRCLLKRSTRRLSLQGLPRPGRYSPKYANTLPEYKDAALEIPSLTLVQEQATLAVILLKQTSLQTLPLVPPYLPLDLARFQGFAAVLLRDARVGSAQLLVQTWLDMVLTRQDTHCSGNKSATTRLTLGRCTPRGHYKIQVYEEFAHKHRPLVGPTGDRTSPLELRPRNPLVSPAMNSGNPYYADRCLANLKAIAQLAIRSQEQGSPDARFELQGRAWRVRKRLRREK